jgi:hypothetical protein
MKWGRNESVIWPPHGPVNTYGAIFLSFLALCSFLYLRFAFALTPLQQLYLSPTKERCSEMPYGAAWET